LEQVEVAFHEIEGKIKLNVTNSSISMKLWRPWGQCLNASIERSRSTLHASPAIVRKRPAGSCRSDSDPESDVSDKLYQDLRLQIRRLSRQDHAAVLINGPRK
jgi:hypothetical protein